MSILCIQVVIQQLWGVSLSFSLSAIEMFDLHAYNLNIDLHEHVSSCNSCFFFPIISYSGSSSLIFIEHISINQWLIPGCLNVMFISKGKLSEDLRGKPYRYFFIDNLAKCSQLLTKIVGSVCFILANLYCQISFLTTSTERKLLSKLHDVYQQWGSATAWLLS